MIVIHDASPNEMRAGCARSRRSASSSDGLRYRQRILLSFEANPRDFDSGGVARASNKVYFMRMKLRLLSAILTAFALFVVPLGMSKDAGMAMAHAAAATETMDMSGHCAGDERPESDPGSDMKMGCVSACAAIPASQPAPLERIAPPASMAEAFQPRMLTGIPPESETPPPRLS
jgi:hypothetical protein